MAPIPHVQKKKPQKSRPVTVTTDQVYDNNGRTMTYRLQKQTRKDKSQDNETKTAMQHATRSDADYNGSKFIFRDVFPYRKYRLVFNTGQWLNLAEASATVGYTLDGEFYLLFVITSRPEHREVEVDLTNVPDIDTVEVRLVGAPENIRGYLEDFTDTKSLLDSISEIIDNIIGGDDGLEARIEALEKAVGIPYTSDKTISERVSALEEEL